MRIALHPPQLSHGADTGRRVTRDLRPTVPRYHRSGPSSPFLWSATWGLNERRHKGSARVGPERFLPASLAKTGGRLEAYVIG